MSASPKPLTPVPTFAKPRILLSACTGSPILLRLLSRRRGSCLIPIGGPRASCAGDDGAGSPRRARSATKGDAPTHRLAIHDAELPSVGVFAKRVDENRPRAKTE